MTYIIIRDCARLILILALSSASVVMTHSLPHVFAHSYGLRRRGTDLDVEEERDGHGDAKHGNGLDEELSVLGLDTGGVVFLAHKFFVCHRVCSVLV